MQYSSMRNREKSCLCTAHSCRLTLSLPSSTPTFAQPSKEKCISEVVRIGSKFIFRLSKLWKAKFFMLCDVILWWGCRGISILITNLGVKVLTSLHILSPLWLRISYLYPGGRAGEASSCPGLWPLHSWPGWPPCTVGTRPSSPCVPPTTNTQRPSWTGTELAASRAWRPGLEERLQEWSVIVVDIVRAHNVHKSSPRSKFSSGLPGPTADSLFKVLETSSRVVVIVLWGRGTGSSSLPVLELLRIWNECDMSIESNRRIYLDWVS